MTDNDISKLFTVDPKLKCDKQVSAKLDTYTYEMLKSFSKLTGASVSTIIREVLYYFLIENKAIDKI